MIPVLRKVAQLNIKYRKKCGPHLTNLLRGEATNNNRVIQMCLKSPT